MKALQEWEKLYAHTIFETTAKEVPAWAKKTRRAMQERVRSMGERGMSKKEKKSMEVAISRLHDEMTAWLEF